MKDFNSHLRSEIQTTTKNNRTEQIQYLDKPAWKPTKKHRLFIQLHPKKTWSKYKSCLILWNNGKSKSQTGHICTENEMTIKLCIPSTKANKLFVSISFSTTDVLFIWRKNKREVVYLSLTFYLGI